MIIIRPNAYSFYVLLDKPYCPVLYSLILTLHEIRSIYLAPVLELYSFFPEQMEIIVSNVKSTSVTITLNCNGRNEFTEHYVLECEEQHPLDITISCEQSINLTDLYPSTVYSLVKRYSDEIVCSKKINTPSKYKKDW